ncbi:hypothetical protein DMI69_10895 [Escherichia coli]|nr:hypothetical protein [Escherichia coli]
MVNLQPPRIIATWQRGDIDGAYVWAPAVNALKRWQGADRFDIGSGSGRRHWTSGSWKDFAEKHPEVVKAFAKSAIDAQQPPLLTQTRG